MTNVIRIDLSKVTNNLDQVIKAQCDAQGVAGFKLASTFVIGTDLVLIF